MSKRLKKVANSGLVLLASRLSNMAIAGLAAWMLITIQQLTIDAATVKMTVAAIDIKVSQLEKTVFRMP